MAKTMIGMGSFKTIEELKEYIETRLYPRAVISNLRESKTKPAFYLAGF